MFNIENSKFYTEIMGALVTFFEKDLEATTEAELHQALIDAGTAQKFKADTTAAVQKEFSEKLEALQTSVTDMQTKITNLETEANESKTQIDALANQLSEKEKEVEAATASLATANTKIKALSGEIATLKAGGGKVDQSQTTDEGIEGIKETAAQFGTVIKGDAMAKSLFGEK